MATTTTKEYQKEVANTIMQQIKSLDPFALMAYGSKDFMFFDLGLTFKVNGRYFKGRVFIHYSEGTDLYKIEFQKIKRTLNRELSEISGQKFYNSESVIEKTFDGVYCDMLIDILDYIEKGPKA